MSLRRFKVLLEWNEDTGGYTVTIPALPGCVTEGDTTEEALANAKEAILGFLEAMRMQGKPISIPDPRIFFGEVEVPV